ncbi:integrase core domain-containing protein, partial [Patescibacteria group bacterium]|nr:integrase core domain-containing protein [Patescibacteria group bacterium]
VVSFNHNLTEWLIEYNFKRPHQSLNYETPIKFNNSIKVSPMYPSSTTSTINFVDLILTVILEIIFYRLLYKAVVEVSQKN